MANLFAYMQRKGTPWNNFLLSLKVSERPDTALNNNNAPGMCLQVANPKPQTLLSVVIDAAVLGPAVAFPLLFRVRKVPGGVSLLNCVVCRSVALRHAARRLR